MTSPSPKKRQAEFINPPNTLKLKIGTGGLATSVIEKAQKVIDDQSGDDFISIAQRQLAIFQEGIRLCETRQQDIDVETLLATLIHPAMQLKANGAMFKYKLVTTICARLIHILELVEMVNADLVELMDAYHTVLKAILSGKMTGDGGAIGSELTTALETATQRYLTKYQLSL